MTDKKKKPPKTDKRQSERFKEAARELEAAGELNLADAEETFERELRRIAPEKALKEAGVRARHRKNAE